MKIRVGGNAGASLRVVMLILLFACPTQSVAAGPIADRGIDDNFFSEGGILDGSGSSSAVREEGVRTTPSLTGDSSQLASTGFKIFGVLGLLAMGAGGVYRFLRKSPMSLWRGGLVKRIAIEPFGPSQFIQVVEIGGKILVLGISEKGINKLTELEGSSADSVRLWRSQEDGKRLENPTGFRGVLDSLGTFFGESGTALPEKVAADSISASRKRLQELAL